MGIRLLTANLLNGKGDAGDLARILDRYQPDLVLTQEMVPEAAEVIAARYPHHHLRPRNDTHGLGIASRLQAVFGRLPLPWRSGIWARIADGETRLTVANVHMRNPVVFPWWKSARLRGEQMDALIDWADDLGSEEPMIVAGDMNATPTWPVYQRLVRRWDDLVVDSARSSEEKTEPTWAWRPGFPRMLRIDHVFGTGARVVATRVVPVRGSDHAAVVVDLELDGPFRFSQNG
ncbi:MAG: endonuclease/exonuclease/phosphatase family protein [Acidimicrobiia bacterium]